MMATRTFADRADVRFRGKKPPLMITVLPALPLVGYVVVGLGIGDLLFGGVSLLGLVVLAGAGVGLGFTALFLNYVTFRGDGLEISIWILVPQKRQIVPYNRITAVELDEEGGVRIQFENEAGEHDVAGFMARSLNDAASLRDEVKVRQTLPTTLADKTTPVVFEPAPEGAVPSGEGTLSFKTESPKWMRFWFLIFFPIGAAFPLLDGKVNLLAMTGSAIIAGVFAQLLGLLMTRLKYCVIRAEQVDIRGDDDRKHKIPWNQIEDVIASETGWLNVKYNRRGLLLDKGGETEAVVRLSPHSQAAVAASIIQAGVDRAKRAA